MFSALTFCKPYNPQRSPQLIFAYSKISIGWSVDKFVASSVPPLDVLMVRLSIASASQAIPWFTLLSARRFPFSSPQKIIFRGCSAMRAALFLRGYFLEFLRW
jgi:hypothetical protein